MQKQEVVDLIKWLQITPSTKQFYETSPEGLIQYYEEQNPTTPDVSGGAFVGGQESSGRYIYLRADEISEILSDPKDKIRCTVVMRNGSKYKVARNPQGLRDQVGYLDD